MLTLANGVTGLFVFAQCHLLFLNLFIGLGEAWLLVTFARAKGMPASLLMIVANYFSAAAGLLIPLALAPYLDDCWGQTPPLYRIGRSLLLLVGAAFVLTVLIEAPFVLLSLRGTKIAPRRRLALCVGVQAASYLALALLYAPVSSFSLLTDTTRVRDVSTLAPSVHGWVYHVRDGQVWRVRLDGTRAEVVPTNAPDAQGEPRFFYFLWAQHADEKVQLMGQEQRREAPIGPPQRGRIGEIATGANRTFGANDAITFAVDFRPALRRTHTYLPNGMFDRLEHYEIDPSNEYGYGRRLRGDLSLATPVLVWAVRYPIILPDEALVFELQNQVVLMDRKKRIGVLAVGTSPVVVLDVEANE